MESWSFLTNHARVLLCTGAGVRHGAGAAALGCGRVLVSGGAGCFGAALFGFR